MLFQEKLDLRQQLNEAKQQLLQQAEYCTEMGAAVCTLLWGVSSNEEAVKTLLGGVSMAGECLLAVVLLGLQSKDLAL